MSLQCFHIKFCVVSVLTFYRWNFKWTSPTLPILLSVMKQHQDIKHFSNRWKVSILFRFCTKLLRTLGDLFSSVQVSACWTALSLIPQRPQLWPLSSTSSTSTSAVGGPRDNGAEMDGPKSLTERALRRGTHKAQLLSLNSNCCLSDDGHTSPLSVWSWQSVEW